jgi:hypothetical protein
MLIHLSIDRCIAILKQSQVRSTKIRFLNKIEKQLRAVKPGPAKIEVIQRIIAKTVLRLALQECDQHFLAQIHTLSIPGLLDAIQIKHIIAYRSIATRAFPGVGIIAEHILRAI